MRATDHFAPLMRRCQGLSPIRTVVAHPCDETSIRSIAAAAAAGLIIPVLVGPPERLAGVALAAGIDITAFEVRPAPHSHAAAALAVRLIREGAGKMLMKGSLHTDELMAEVVATTTGLRTARRISHIYVMGLPSYPRLLLITDAAINIDPILETKRDIVQNAIELAHALGLPKPRVAILSAVETVNPQLKSTLDAAALSKMADRGQIVGGLVEGPLAFDNAINIRAARDKGLSGPVAGKADILVAPDLEAGNMLAKQLTFLAGAKAAGVVVGAKVPIVLTSRADTEQTHIASCAIGRLLAEHYRVSPPLKAAP